MRTLTVANPRGRWLRDRALPAAAAVPPLRRRFTHRTAQLSHSYRNGPLTTRAPHPRRTTIAAGDRLPTVAGLRRNSRPVTTLDLIAGTAHTLLILTGTRPKPNAIQELTARFQRDQPLVQTVIIDGSQAPGARGVVSDPDLLAHRRYHATGGRLLLVRPDGHLAASAPLHRPDQLERYLQHIHTPIMSQATAGPAPRRMTTANDPITRQEVSDGRAA